MTTVSIKPRLFKCKPFLITGLAEEWMGKEVTPTIPQEELVYEFENAEYAKSFEKCLETRKV